MCSVEGEQLRGHVLRCAAAADIAVEQVDGQSAARAAWQRAPVVVLDEVMAKRLAMAEFPRRDRIAVVCASEPGPRTWAAALSLGARIVVTLPAEEPELSALFAESTQRSDTGAGTVIAVLGGCGGAGASVFAGALAAIAARRGRDTLLVDCDPIGGGLDGTIGLGELDGMRWPDLRLADGRLTGGSLRSALPARVVRRATVAVLGCRPGATPPGEQAVGAVLDAGVRVGNTVVCDIGRRLDAGGRAALSRADLCAVLVPARPRACAAAKGVVGQAIEAGAEPCAVVRGPSPAGMRPTEVAVEVGVPLLVAMRSEAALPATVEAGGLLDYGKGPLASAALVVLGAAVRDLPAAGNAA
ncbi:septum site-determining protein Ssd [Sciscionella marina]|uniref:septum site-determining protein Ssd n=1 Tax=Sciscionella marina TaxID=508770 RepID=UPI0003665A6D|nr:septum site-determining protein Ssd [Sciscionella marina]